MVTDNNGAGCARISSCKLFIAPHPYSACGFHGNEIASVLSDLHEQGSGACQGLKSADGLWSMPKKRERQRMRDRVEKKRKGCDKVSFKRRMG